MANRDSTTTRRRSPPSTSASVTRLPKARRPNRAAYIKAETARLDRYCRYRLRVLLPLYRLHEFEMCAKLATDFANDCESIIRLEAETLATAPGGDAGVVPFSLPGAGR